MSKRIVFIVTVLFISLPGIAQTNKHFEPRQKDEMHVEMPDETEETDLVDKGQLQFETQGVCNWLNDGGTALIGQAMLRYGIAERLEGRVLVEEGKKLDEYMEQTVQSTYPLAVSMKFSLVKDHKILPDITLVTYLKLPFTSRADTQRIYWSPIALLAFQNKFGEKWKLEYNGGIQQEAYSSQWVGLVNASVHYKITDKLEAFGEYFSQYKKNEDAHHNAGLGMAYQCNHHIEVYASAAGSIFYSEPNRFINAGIAFRTD